MDHVLVHSIFTLGLFLAAFIFFLIRRYSPFQVIDGSVARGYFCAVNVNNLNHDDAEEL